MSYIPDVFRYVRRSSSEVHVGALMLGAANPIRLQSMTNTSTMDTQASVDQVLRLVEAGSEMVRLTAQGVREAVNLAQIKALLVQQGCTVPLVADIHFNPKAADEAALHVEKVRINPGNFVDSAKTFKSIEYTDATYQEELKRIEERFVPFLERCRAQGTTIRIGVNHGSLSDRILSRYGDTPQGLVESCMEFLRLCVAHSFTDVVLSVKASNTRVMVQSVRLLVKTMQEAGMSFPLHLGVTEAGDGEDGRIKSAVGTGSLLMDGLGDTIRISLSEEPELEIAVGRKLLEQLQQRIALPGVEAETYDGFDPYTYQRRIAREVGAFGGKQPPRVLLRLPKGQSPDPSDPALSGELKAEFVWSDSGAAFPVYLASELKGIDEALGLCFVRCTLSDLTAEWLEILSDKRQVVLLLETAQGNNLWERRAFFHRLMQVGCDVPVILSVEASYEEVESMQLGLSLDFGPLLLDGFGEGLMVNKLDTDRCSNAALVDCMYGILQASRMRMSKTEYISCPGCGRTLFGLQQTIAAIKARTSHLKGLKIGIMGCIVNGPGEMADADYGYVGAGKNKISLYKGQECIIKSVPQEEAVERLVELIKRCGDWQEPVV